MQFAVWLEGKERGVPILHVAGPPASGKTTLVDLINRNHSHVVAKDLDDFDDAAMAIKGWRDKKDFTPERLRELHALRHKLYYDFLRDAGKPVVLAGIHREGDTRYPIPKSTRKVVLDVDPVVVATRQYERAKAGDDQFSARKSAIPAMARAAAAEIEDLIASGYDPRKQNEILGWVKHQKVTK